LYLLIMMTMSSFNAVAQVDSLNTYRSHVYLEIGGIGGFGSFNYERILLTKTKLKLGATVGISTIGLTDFENEFNPDLIFPFAVRAWFGATHHIEIGIGNTFASTVQVDRVKWEAERELRMHGNFLVGYRYQKRGGRMIWRCHYSPIIQEYEYYRHWGGFSVGWSF